MIRIYAGYDETSVWQEFGEMKFQTKEDYSRRVGQSRPHQAALGADALRAVDQLEGGADAMGTVVRAAGRELRHHHA